MSAFKTPESVTSRAQNEVIFANATLAEMIALIRQIGITPEKDRTIAKTLDEYAIDVIDNLRAINAIVGDCMCCESTAEVTKGAS